MKKLILAILFVAVALFTVTGCAEIFSGIEDITNATQSVTDGGHGEQTSTETKSAGFPWI